MKAIEFTASGTGPEAMRQALGGIAQQLAAAGGAPMNLTAMTWTTDDPDAFDPASKAVQLACRESFAGFCPQVLVVRGTEKLVIQAKAVFGPPPDAVPVWRGMNMAVLAQEYSPRNQVPSMQGVFDGWRAGGAAFRARHAPVEFAYGRSEWERLDLFMPSGATNPPLFIFIHGGYWQAADKHDHSQFAAGMLRHGYAVAMPNYSLAPIKPLFGIVAEVQASIAFLWRAAGQLGFDRDHITISGHSAGGHLSAMMATTDWTQHGLPVDTIKGAQLLSGLFDLTPHGLLPMGRLLGLDNKETIAAMSPAGRKPPDHVKLHVAVGEKESAEFRRQSKDVAISWGAPPSRVVPGRQHFDLIDELIDGELLEAMLKLAP